MIEENKDAWMDQEIKSLSSRIFNDSYDYQDNASGLTKAEERILLNKFNDIVIYLAEKNEINQTFLFSKKNQKYFLRLAINVGLDNALLEITQWRSDLFGEPLTKILKTI